MEVGLEVEIVLVLEVKARNELVLLYPEQRPEAPFYRLWC